MTQPEKPRIIKILGREIRIPASRIGRIILGVLFVFFGLLGFLPILGFWMVPVGLLILSQDLAIVRRWRRRFSVWWARRRAQKSTN
jgi:purine-cytosine permease-like protein